MLRVFELFKIDEEFVSTVPRMITGTNDFTIYLLLMISVDLSDDSSFATVF